MAGGTTNKQLMDTLQQRIAQEPGLMDNAAELAQCIREEAGVISDVAVLDLLRELRNETQGLGGLEAICARPGVTDVVVNGAGSVFVDCGNGLEPADIHLGDEDQVRRLATRLIVACGQRLDDAQPFADGRVHRDDGTILRIHALLSPPAENGVCLSIRILRQATTLLEDLVAGGSVPRAIAGVLKTIVERKKSFVVIGGTGSGKTTLLSALLATVPVQERILVIEDTAELKPSHPHVVSLVSRRANAEGAGEITMSDLLRQSLRMRPDRIVVGEIRGAEIVDLLAALNTGHDGGAGTLHANSILEVPARMEALAALGGMDRHALHSQLAAAVDVVLCTKRDRNGTRRLHQIGVLTGNPVTASVVWSAESGPQPGFDEFLASLGMQRQAPTPAHEPSQQRPLKKQEQSGQQSVSATAYPSAGVYPPSTADWDYPFYDEVPRNIRGDRGTGAKQR